MLVTKEPLIQTMACVNWPDTYPDRPEVEFDVRCTGEELLLAYVDGGGDAVSAAWSALDGGI